VPSSSRRVIRPAQQGARADADRKDEARNDTAESDIARNGDNDPGRASTPPSGRGLFYRVRVGILLAVLASVIIYALRDHRSRQGRRAWQRPLQIALVLLERGTLDPGALEQFEQRTAALELTLEREFRRYGGDFQPFQFRRFGPVAEAEAAPRASADPGWLEPLRVSWALYHFARRSDAAALLDGDFDGKVYVVLSPPRSSKRAFVEGLGQDGGRIAVTSIELSEDSVDFGLFVITHELFHLLGAGDRYAANGSALVPEGLGDPERVPLYPQDTAEVMARGRVIEPGREVAPSDLEELRVGPQTAAEIGWAPSGDGP
jgi:hypothetical protein